MRDWVQPGKGGPHFYLSIHFEAGGLRALVAALGLAGFTVERRADLDRYVRHWVAVDVHDAKLELESHHCEQGDAALPLLAHLASALRVSGWRAVGAGDGYAPVEAGQGDHAALCRYLDLPA